MHNRNYILPHYLVKSVICPVARIPPFFTKIGRDSECRVCREERIRKSLRKKTREPWIDILPFLSAFAASEARGRGGCQATYDLPACPRWYKKANLYLSAYNLLNTNYYNPAGLTG